MHERTQRAISRLMFVFCCALPTALVVLSVLVSWTPWYHHRALRGLEADLSQRSGLVVHVDDFERSAPSTIRLHGVRVLQPESLREIARVRQVQWVRQSDSVSILLQQPELQSAHLRSTWRLIHDRFLCRPDQTDRPVQFAANDLTIHSRSGPYTLRDVDAWIEPIDQAVEVSIQCLPANASGDPPISLTVRRDRSRDQAETRWTLDTHDRPLPCSALAEFAPDVIGILGSEAVFTGTMQGTQAADGGWIDLGGSRLQQISLDRLFEKQAHRVTGSASIHLERCRIEPGQRIDIAGSLVARDGIVGRSLLLSAHRHLAFDVQVPEGEGDVLYDRIALRFNINQTQLRLDGICRTEVGYEGFPVGVVMCVDGYPRVRSAGQTLQAMQLMTALAPPHSVLVPLANQNRGLMSLLIPPSRPLPATDVVPSPRIRTARRPDGGPAVAQPR